MATPSAFPVTKVAQLGEGTLALGVPRGGHDWQLDVVYRGLHCPICKTYLAGMQELQAEFNALGVDVVGVSAAPEEKAQAFAGEKALTLAVGYGLSPSHMGALGLYVSGPRTPPETDRPFSEPGLFVINAKGEIQIPDVSNAPFARSDL